MRQVLLSMMAVVLLAMPVRADDAAIRAVISSQIEAFQVDDFDRAFTYASPTIQGIFGDAVNFGSMVRRGYPMVWRPAEVTYLSTDTIAGQLWQNVMIRDQSGALHILEYQMISGESGWKINAVRLRKDADGAV